LLRPLFYILKRVLKSGVEGFIHPFKSSNDHLFELKFIAIHTQTQGEDTFECLERGHLVNCEEVLLEGLLLLNLSEILCQTAHVLHGVLGKVSHGLLGLDDLLYVLTGEAKGGADLSWNYLFPHVDDV